MEDSDMQYDALKELAELYKEKGNIEKSFKMY